MATPKKMASGRWWVQIEVAGQRESATHNTKIEATNWAARRSTEMRTLRSGDAGRLKTLRDAMRKYAAEVSPTKKGERWETIRLAAFEKPEHAPLPIGRKIGEIRPAELALWRDARLASVSRSTVLRDMNLLAAVFECARREWQWVEKNPVRDVRRPGEPDHRERIIAGTEARRMLRQLGWAKGKTKGKDKIKVSSMSQAASVCFAVALMTGMRAGELCSLRWEDVQADHVRLQARAQGGKTGKRDVPLTPGAVRAIERMRGFDQELVFGLKTQTLDALFRRARERAGLEGFTFHDSRHTAATRLAQQLHVLDLCKVFGWKQTTRALTYYNPSASDLAKRMTRRSA